MYLAHEKKIKRMEDQIERYRVFSNTSVGEQRLDSWHCLLNNIQGDLGFYINGHVDHMYDSSKRLEDYLFGWGYIINLDTKELEIYRSNMDNISGSHYGRYCQSVDKQGRHGALLIGTIKFSTIRKMKIVDIIQKLEEMNKSNDKYLGLQIWEKKKIIKNTIQARLDAI